MLVQAAQPTESAGTKVTLVGLSVPGLTGGLVLRGAGPTDQLLGHHAVGISRPDEIVQLIAVKVGSRGATALFKVMRKSCGCREIILAEGTGNGMSAMCGRVEMHLYVVVIQKGSVAIGTVVMVVNFMLR